MRWKADEVDLWCAEWAETRRKIHGITLAVKLEPKERLGKLACTLGRIAESEKGATDSSVINQNWPEVYSGMGLLIHRAWYEMPNPKWRLVMDAHYVWKEIPVKLKVPVIGIVIRDYWTQLDLLKAYLVGFVRPNRESLEGAYRPITSERFVRNFG